MKKKLFETSKLCAEFLECCISTIINSCRGRRDDKIWDIKYEKVERKIEENENIIWKLYPECNKYLVSNTGEVKNKKTDRLMMGSKQNGYRCVTMFINKSIPKMNRLIHRMVAQAFLENPDNKPIVNHKDTNILNNQVNNLEWCTYKENMNTPKTIENLKKGKNSKTILQVEIDTGNIVNIFYGASDVQNKTGIDQGYILRICHFYNGSTSKLVCNRKKMKYFFIFEEDKNSLCKFLEIAKKCVSVKQQVKWRKKSVVQLNKDTNDIIKSFDSIYTASKELNINYSGISQCCNYYKYTNDTRPKCYKSKSSGGFIFKFNDL